MYEEISVIGLLALNAIAYYLRCEDFVVLISLAIALVYINPFQQSM